MSDLRSKLIRLAHENPDLRSDLLPLLGKTASKLPTLDDAGQKLMLEAINGLLKKAKIPVKWTNFSETAMDFPVPKGLDSLFSTLSVEIEWWDGKIINGRVSWRYNHPSGGSNGQSIGVVVHDPNGKPGQQWGWRNDSRGQSDWGFVG